jgi:hypothetical protein
LGPAFVLLLSASEGERNAGILGVQRTLQGIARDKDVDIHALADRVEGKKAGNGAESLSEAAQEKIRATVERARLEGYAEGVKAAESKHHGTGEFRNTDGKLEWSEVALFLQREKHRLDPRHHQFVDDMASRTVWGREPTPKQHQYLHSLLLKLGGPGAIT